MEELEKSMHVNLLIDYYGNLLTSHQLEILSLYYQMDLSLSEISQQLQISRNGVYDALKKGTKILEKYEDKLKLIKKDHELEVFFDDLKLNRSKKDLELIELIESKVK